MTRELALTGWRQQAWAALLALPSLFVVYRFIGPVATCAYAAGVPIAVQLGYNRLWTALRSRLTPRASNVLVALALTVLALLAALAYPLLNAGWACPGGGTDRDDALVLLVRECLAGRYPYYAVTYLGNPISPLPGAGLLALPFVLTHQMALQDIFWIIIAVVWMSRKLPIGSLKALFVLTNLLLSPEVLREVVTGDDMLANALYVTLTTGWFLGIASRQRPSPVRLAGASMLLGIALSSRGLYLLAVPLLLCHVYRHAGGRRAAISVGGVLATFAAVTLPFYLYDPAGFSPLHTMGMLFLPGPLCWAAIGLMLLVSLLVGVAVQRPGLAGFYERTALILLLAVVTGSISAAVHGGTWGSLDVLSHAVASLVFGAAALCLRGARGSSAPPSEFGVGSTPSRA